MRRAILMVLDSFGVGGAEDAARFGDDGSDTFGHIAATCAAGGGDRAGLRSGPLYLPNLDRLGTREPEVYGTQTLAEIHDDLARLATELEVELEFLQSNHEGVLIDALHGARDRCHGVLLNA